MSGIVCGTRDSNTVNGDFPGGPAVKTALPLQGARVQALLGELKIQHALPKVCILQSVKSGSSSKHISFS